MSLRSGSTSFQLPVLLTALLFAVLLSPTAFPQPDTNPNGTDRSNTADEASDEKEENGNEQYDGAYLDKKQTEIDQLIKQRNFGEAYETAFNVRKNFEDVEDDKLNERSRTLYNDVLSRLKKAYNDVRTKANRYRKAGQPYRAYKHIQKEAKNFKGTAPYHRRLRRYLRTLKPDVVEAYRNGKLDERPDFFLDNEPSKTDRDDRTTDDSQSGTEQKKEKKSATPRINASEPCMSNAPGSPKVFEGKVVNTTENSVHFDVDFKGANSRQKMGYFLFELEGLKGREIIRIDLKNMGRWSNSKSIVPMYSRGVEALSDLSALRARPPQDGTLEYVKTPGGQKVPKTNGLQKWHYFKHVKINEEEHTLTIRKRFPNQMTHTYIAHRPPYTYGYHKTYMKKLKERAEYGAKGLTVHEVGKSKGGRPLHIVELANPTDPKAKKKPVIVFTSGEHPDEMDTYQAMKGTLEFLLSDQQVAKTLRKKATYLFVPVLDPDGLVKSMYENICYTFTDEGSFAGGQPSTTSTAYAKWFRKWVNDGRRLDLHLLTHCVESGETDTHLFNYLIEPKSGRHEMSKALWRHVRDQVRSNGFRVTDTPSGQGYTSNRLGGFMRFMVGTMQLFVEFNSQARSPARKLTLHEIQNLGRHLVISAVDFLYRKKSAPLRRNLKRSRKKRSVLAERYAYFDRVPMLLQTEEPFGIERWLHALPEYERSLKKEKNEDPDTKRWIGQRLRLLYQKYDDISPANIPNFESN